MDDNQGPAPDLTFTISDTSSNPAASDAPAWIRNPLDGQSHPALNTDIKEVVWDNDRRAFSILNDSDIFDKCCNMLLIGTLVLTVQGLPYIRRPMPKG